MRRAILCGIKDTEIAVQVSGIDAECVQLRLCQSLPISTCIRHIFPAFASSGVGQLRRVARAGKMWRMPIEMGRA